MVRSCIKLNCNGTPERGEHTDGDAEGFRAGRAVRGSDAGGRKGFFRAYELRMDTLVTHPQFEYRVSYRRVLEIHVRLLARYPERETGSYPVFLTR
jgi:CRISP-associated protein Cas1